MGELLDYVKDRYGKRMESNTKDMMNKQKVKNAISEMCETYLEDADSELTFEILPKDLPYGVAVISEEPLRSKYVISQITPSLFVARLKEIEL